MNSTILIVEDDPDIQELLSTALISFSFNTICVSTGEDAVNSLGSQSPDLVLLDVQLPDTNGFDVCEKIRTISSVPIIFLSCLDDGSDVIRGLELGADDYVTKPFDLQQLIARINSNLRRATFINKEVIVEKTQSPKTPDSFQVGSLTFHFQQQRITVKNEHVPLSIKEFLILSILAQQPDKAFSANELYTMIWGEDSLGETRTIKVHISNLRKKLENYTGDEIGIQTVRGFGYKLEVR